MNVLVTGAAGFIGFHISKWLLQSGYRVYGLDNFSSFYDVSLKRNRLKELEGVPGDLTFEALDLLNTDALNSFSKWRTQIVLFIWPHKRMCDTQ